MKPTPTYHLQAMTLDDYDEVVALWNATEGVGLNESDSRPNISIFLQRNPSLSLVARTSSGQIIGAILCGHDGRRGYLHHLAVAMDARKQGIGKALVDRCLNSLKEMNIPKCNIFVFANNESGKTFWKHQGWVSRCDLEVIQKVL